MISESLFVELTEISFSVENRELCDQCCNGVSQIIVRHKLQDAAAAAAAAAATLRPRRGPTPLKIGVGWTPLEKKTNFWAF